MTEPILYDMLIIGGGINGTAIAADAAGRGLKVLLCEQGDLASQTSSASSKLIHGGLRYLEYFEFKLVREALTEREILLQKAPHLIRPLPFVLPHHQGLRPKWLLQLGLFLYDRIGGSKKFSRSKMIELNQDPLGQPLKQSFKTGFLYFDCWGNDARLVISNALLATQYQATILTRTKLTQATRTASHWECTLQDQRNQNTHIYQAKTIVNASGPWVNVVLKNYLNCKPKHPLCLVKGSHILVPKQYVGDHAYLLQNIDRRMIFVSPFDHDLNLIGTTEIECDVSENKTFITDPEIDYLLSAVNAYFKKSLTKDDIVHSYAGIRPLLNNQKKEMRAITRDYLLDFQASTHEAPLLNIYGGKITTHRKLAEHALNQFRKYFPLLRTSWTARALLPGGELSLSDCREALQKAYPWISASYAQRLACTYGTRAYLILQNKKEVSELGFHFGEDLYEAEIRYLCEHEWAETSEDILWRRTQLGLRLNEKEQTRLADWILLNRPQ